MCEQLVQYHIPETLNHGDFHYGNVFVRGGRFSFIDWGDSCVSQPFYSLRTVLVSAEISLGLEENSRSFGPYATPTWSRGRVTNHARTC